jgi:hypothetical protein
VEHTPPLEVVVPLVEPMVVVEVLALVVALEPTCALSCSGLYFVPVGSATMVGSRSRTLRGVEFIALAVQL